MRTKNFLKHLILGALLLTTGKVVSQATVTGNVATATSDFLGWDNTSPANDFELMVRHDGNFPIHFFTDATFRMLLNEKITYPVLNGFPNIVANGFGLITPDGTFQSNAQPKGPFSRLHLAESGVENAQHLGYRPWQRNGITFTGNGDQGYMGHKYNFEPETDYTDMVIQWSDNPENWKGDRLRFIFTSEYFQGTPTGMNSEEGLEGMRLYPTYENGINVGVGDFFADGTDPTERFHVLDGRVRIEELPNDAPAVGLTKVMMVDDAALPSDERGVVKWMDISDLVPDDCEWSMLTTGTGNRNVSTAFGPASATCPDLNDAVGIGVDLAGATAAAKLNVVSGQFAQGQRTNLTTVTPNPIGGFFDVTGGTAQNYGLWSNVHGATVRNAGIWTESHDATYSAWGGIFNSYDEAEYTHGAQGTVYGGIQTGYGLFGWSRSNALLNIGVLGRSNASTTDASKTFRGVSGVASLMDPSQTAIGVYGTAPVAANSWAGYFDGDVHIAGIASCTGMIWGSDANIKTNVQPITGALDRIMQLQPSTYNFMVAENPAMGLPSGQQRGLIAQQAMEVLPDIVSDIRTASVLDTAGVEIYPAETIKGINYVALVPELVAAMQEQQALIANLQDQINNCCAAPGGMAPENGDHGAAPKDGMLQEQRLLIIPNPVADLTRLEYYVPKAGKVSLQVSNSEGKFLATLREEMAQEGAHNYSWNTTDLAAGTYFCTYMLDGTVVVKRAIKVR